MREMETRPPQLYPSSCWFLLALILEPSANSSGPPLISVASSMAGRGRRGCSGERRRRRRPARARKWRRKRSGHRLRRLYIPAPAANQRRPLAPRRSAPGGFRRACSTRPPAGGRPPTPAAAPAPGAAAPCAAPVHPCPAAVAWSAACSRRRRPPRTSAYSVPPRALPAAGPGAKRPSLPRAGTGRQTGTGRPRRRGWRGGGGRRGGWGGNVQPRNPV